MYKEKMAKNALNGRKITTFFGGNQDPREPLLVQENILGQNIFQSHSSEKIYFYSDLRVKTSKIYLDPILQTKYILGCVTH